jgi:thiosulfate/3-mercaptopyruvate sulfurtransferase
MAAAGFDAPRQLGTLGGGRREPPAPCLLKPISARRAKPAMTRDYTALIQPDELQPMLRHPGWAVFDCRHALLDKAYGQRAYRESHLPGARFADVGHDLSAPITPLSGRHPLPDPAVFAAWLASRGVSADSQVVAYDDSHGAMAARLWWMLRYLGHPRVAVLDGGFVRWRKEGRPVTPDVPRPARGNFLGWPDGSLLAELEEVERLSRERSAVLVDARGGERYRGETEPIDPKPGHIPGAVNLPYAGNLDAEGRFLAPDLLRRRLEPAVTGAPPGQSVHYCGSGVSACHNLLAMLVAGLPPGRLYVGSWSQWCKDPARPVATGPRP